MSAILSPTEPHPFPPHNVANNSTRPRDRPGPLSVAVPFFFLPVSSCIYTLALHANFWCSLFQGPLGGSEFVTNTLSGFNPSPVPDDFGGIFCCCFTVSLPHSGFYFFPDSCGSVANFPFFPTTTSTESVSFSRVILFIHN